MSVLWWFTKTRPDEPCRKTAVVRGWFAGLLHLMWARWHDRMRSEINGLARLDRQKNLPTA